MRILRWFFTGPKGVYYRPCTAGEPTVRLLEVATGRTGWSAGWPMR